MPSSPSKATAAAYGSYARLPYKFDAGIITASALALAASIPAIVLISVDWSDGHPTATERTVPDIFRLLVIPLLTLIISSYTRSKYTQSCFTVRNRGLHPKETAILSFLLINANSVQMSIYWISFDSRYTPEFEFAFYTPLTFLAAVSFWCSLGQFYVAVAALEALKYRSMVDPAGQADSVELTPIRPRNATFEETGRQGDSRLSTLA